MVMMIMTKNDIHMRLVLVFIFLLKFLLFLRATLYCFSRCGKTRTVQ